MKDYELIDSGNGQKLERFGPYVIVRPCAQALWKPTLSQSVWDNADCSFSREGEGGWKSKKELPTSWHMQIENLKFLLERTDFGHLGLFPEHTKLWSWLGTQFEKYADFSLLNLFGYTGAATLFAASQGAHVCHLDASKKVVERARQNAQINNLTDKPIRWIVDDVFKFLKREIKRNREYDGIILDPPSFGRGSKGEVFKFEADLDHLIELVQKLLSKRAAFVLLTCHTPG